MGNQPAPSDELLEAITANYSLLRTEKHPLFGRISLYHTSRPSPYPFVMRQDHYLHSSDDSHKKLKFMNKEAPSRPDYLLKQLGIRQSKHENLCSDTVCLRVYYEYIDLTLRRRIQAARASVPFEPAEIRLVMVSIANCLAAYQKSNKFFSVLTTQHVLIGKHNKIKIVDPECINEEDRSPDDLLRSGFADPDLLRCLLLKRTQLNNYDPFKANVWAAGLIFLELLTLEPPVQIYNYQSMTILEDKLNDIIQRVKTTFGPKLAVVLRSMLTVDAFARTSAAGLAVLINNAF